MAPTIIKCSIFIWLEFVLILIVNLAVMFVTFLLNSPNMKRFTQPLFISIFITIAIINRFPSIFYLFLFVLFYTLIPESSKPKIEKEVSEQENDTIEHNEDNQTEALEANQNESQAEATQEQNQSLFEKLGSMNLITTFFVLFAWLSSIQNGIDDNSFLRYGAKSYQSFDNFHIPYLSYEKKILINCLFYRLFKYATYQFIYGAFVLIDEPPKWLYYFYMIPQAIFYPISSLFSYYVAQTNYVYYFENIDYATVLNVFFMYFSIKMFNQFNQSCKDEGELSNKIISIVMYAIGILWMIFIHGIYSMNTEYFYKES